MEVLFSAEPQTDTVDAAVITCLQLHLNEPMQSAAEPDAGAGADAGDGEQKRVVSSYGRDILVFLTGAEEIEVARKLLEG